MRGIILLLSLLLSIALWFGVYVFYTRMIARLGSLEYLDSTLRLGESITQYASF